MARTAQQKMYADFRQGFVTVANPLAYPEGSVKDIVNFDIEDNGTIRTRAGLVQEPPDVIDTGYSLDRLSDYAVSLHVWDNVSNRGDTKLAVVQVAGSLKLFSMDNTGIDTTNMVAEINLPIPFSQRHIKITAVSGNGWLFVAHPGMRPHVIKEENGVYSTESITIKIRDTSLWRGETEEQTGFSSSSLFPQHEYNMRNAGWPRSSNVSKESDPNSGVEVADPILYTHTKLSKYPVVSIPFHSAKAGGGDNLDEQMAYNPWAIENDSYFGLSKPPLGRYIVDAESWNRSGEGKTFLYGNPFLTKKYSWLSYPTSIEFYAGRVWYCGAQGYEEETTGGSGYTKKDNLDTSNTVYFSQQLDIDLDKVGLCYQENDPTAEDLNALLPTDGGTISIRGAGDIFAIRTYQTSLLIFSDQGVWAISGQDGNSFKADNSSVVKISNIGPASKESISFTSDSIFFAADDAIYVVTSDEVSGRPAVQDMTSGRIKDFYNELSNEQKDTAILAYNKSERLFYMFYKNTEDRVEDTAFIPYTRVLIFNQDLGCFYKYSIKAVDNYMLGSLFYTKDKFEYYQEPVTLNDGSTLVTLNDEVTPLSVEYAFGVSSDNSLQILTVTEGEDGRAKLFFSTFSDDETFEDWGTPYTPYVEFGFDAAGDLMRDSKKAPILISHMTRTENGFTENPLDPEGNSFFLSRPSSCLMSYAWDWSNKYNNPVELYRFNRLYIPTGSEDPFDYLNEVITTRTRIRGKGTSLGLRLEGSERKDCRVLGLGILYTAAQRV